MESADAVLTAEAQRRYYRCFLLNYTSANLVQLAWIIIIKHRVVAVLLCRQDKCVTSHTAHT